MASAFINGLKTVIKASVANKNLIIFVFALSISTLLWFIYKFDKEYISSIYCKPTLINLPEDKILKKPLPDTFYVVVKARGWDILRIKYARTSLVLAIDYSHYKNRHFVLSSNLKKNIKGHLIGEVEVLQISPDTIFFDLDNQMEKSVRVIPDYEIEYRKQYGLSGEAKTFPDKINISGPASIVKHINLLKTEKLILKDIHKTVVRTVAITTNPEANIILNTPKVKIEIPVEKTTEGHFMIPVEVIGTKAKGMKLIPDKVKVSFQAPISIFNEIEPSAFSVYVDPSSGEKKGRLKVYYTVSGKYIYKIKVEPELVDFIIEK